MTTAFILAASIPPLEAEKRFLFALLIVLLSDPSLLAQTGFPGNSWPISVCLDSGFSKLRWLFRSDKYAVVLGAEGWGVGG